MLMENPISLQPTISGNRINIDLESLDATAVGVIVKVLDLVQ